MKTRLLEWSLATFHTVFFLSVLIALIYFTGSLGAILSNLSTLVGLALFAAFWFTTWWCTRKVVQQVAEQVFDAPLADVHEIIRVLALAALWGGVDGFLFLMTILGGLTLVAIYTLFVAPFSTPPFPILIIGVFGLPFAFIFGAVIGIFFALLDGALLHLPRILFLFAKTH